MPSEESSIDRLPVNDALGFRHGDKGKDDGRGEGRDFQDLERHNRGLDMTLDEYEGDEQGQ